MAVNILIPAMPIDALQVLIETNKLLYIVGGARCQDVFRDSQYLKYCFFVDPRGIIEAMQGKSDDEFILPAAAYGTSSHGNELQYGDD